MTEKEYFETPILDKLEEDGALNVSYNSEYVCLFEDYSGAFSSTLSVDEFRQLIKELTWILNQIDSGKAPPAPNLTR